MMRLGQLLRSLHLGTRCPRVSNALISTALIGACALPAPVDTEVGLEEEVRADSIAPSEVSTTETDTDAESRVGTEVPPCQVSARSEPRWYDGVVGYEIFVRSFKDSDGDGVGDLPGLTSMLDYLNDGDPETSEDLGVGLLWLMPINESPSYHGYDVTNYDAVDSEYGSDEDLTTLLAEAESRGIRILVDLVLNHSSSQHPWFLDALSGPNAPYRDFYVWSDSDPGWTQPWSSGGTWHKTPSGYYYGLFWDGMPDLNFASPTVQATMSDVATQWLSRGVAGFRLDAVRYLVETGGGAGQKDTEETLAYWRRLREASDKAAPDALLLGEAWAESAIVSKYFGSEEKPAMHMAFDFDTAGGLVSAVTSGHGGALKNALCARLEGWPLHGAAGTFATNHDMRRLASRLKVAGPDALRLAAVALMTLPGTPWIYYGQELGMFNGPSSDDIDKRLPMQWSAGPGGGFTSGTPWAAPQSEALAESVAGQSAETSSLLSLYRRLISLRNSTAALQHGGTQGLEVEGTSGVPVAWLRALGDTRTLTVLNPSSEPSTVTIPASALSGAEALVDALEPTAPRHAISGDLSLDMSGFEGRIFVLKAPNP